MCVYVGHVGVCVHVGQDVCVYMCCGMWCMWDKVCSVHVGQDVCVCTCVVGCCACGTRCVVSVHNV